MTDILTKEILDHATELRRELHQHPELSGSEKQTAGRIREWLKKQQPDQIVEGLGGHGIAAVFDSGKPGPTLLFRADLDALPIEEINTFSYKSENPGVSHKCGHDGHMAILSGFAMLLKDRRPQQGRLVLLYQPEEENGQGAAKVIQDKYFVRIKPDYAFALHNLPGFRKEAIIMKEGPFASASKGMVIELKGKSSHAAHPEQGHSPVQMMTDLINRLMDIPKEKKQFRDFVLLTIIHARLGEVAFGTNPGKGVVMATLRTYRDDDMDLLNKKACDLANDLSKKHDIEIEISYTEEFPATNNHPEASNFVFKAMQRAGVEEEDIEAPFRWSEDFGHFTGAQKGALFGIGSGLDHPSLHNHDYDFPDEIIETGIRIFYHIADQIVKLQQHV